MLKRLATFAAVAAAFLAAGCGSNTSTSKAEPSSANKLVNAWRNKSVPPTDPEVVSVQQRLSALACKCHEPEGTLVSQIDAGLTMLGEHGLHGSPLELIAALDKVVGYTRRFHAHAALGCAALLHAVVSTFTEPVNP
jgi:hypothetical protein